MWNSIARFILRKRIYILLTLFILAFIAVFNTKVQLTQSEAQLLPKDDTVYLNFKHFRAIFGQEDNVITIGYKDKNFFKPVNFEKWNDVIKKIKVQKGVQELISIENIQYLKRNDTAHKFDLQNVIANFKATAPQVDSLQRALVKYPFYKDLLYNDKTKAYRSIIILDPKIMDTPYRRVLVGRIDSLVRIYEKNTHVSLYLSGIPVIRTGNGNQIKSEASLFILASLIVTALIFYLFLRNIQAVVIAVIAVLMATVFSFASMHFFKYELTALTAMIPPLLIIIGIPNCIFLINKYQQEYAKHQNKIRALHTTIVKIGMANMMTNLTTAFGFFTFYFVESDTLKQFGLISGLNIMLIFFICISFIPAILSLLPAPKAKHLQHFQRAWMVKMIDTIEYWAINHRRWIFGVTIIIVITSIVCMLRIKTEGNMLDDMAKNKDFYTDIQFFDKEFKGVLPLEIMIDTKKPKGVMSLNTMKRIEQLTQFIQDSIPHSASPIAMDRMVKFIKQSYYNGNPAYYSLPDKQEKSFILQYAQKSTNNTNFLKNYIDKSGRYARITTYLQNTSTAQMEQTFEHINRKKEDLFPKEEYNSYITGAAYVFLNGTYYLTTNLIQSILLAILMIAGLMALMFKNIKMIIISLIPNLIPLLTTGAIMGIFNIPLKPSTILVYSIAFGIAVDDTIHFLATYRHELKETQGDVFRAVINSMRDAGVSLLYTSAVLFFGFGIFVFSSFGGTIALGGLIAVTLLVGIVCDLVLLPALILSFKKHDVYLKDDESEIIISPDEEILNDGKLF